ncbi:MAG TPA: PfkB family carbohydrate kinase [Bacillota bacterium]|nr:PfkB family carbohydrate kinase [Bacillota bacterium]
MIQGRGIGQHEEKPGKMVLVIGDIMLDQHISGRIEKPEGDDLFPAISKYEDRKQLAAAASIASKIKEMGRRVLLAGLVGRDQEGNTIKKMLKAEGIPLVLGMLSTRPTTVRKTINICDRPVLSLVDEPSQDMKTGIFQEIIKLVTILSDDLSTIVMCDYGRGVVTCELVSAITEICSQKDIKTLVLTRKTTRERMTKYLGVELVIIKKALLEQLHRGSPVNQDELELAVNNIIKETGCRACLVASGAEGAYLFKNDYSFIYRPLKKLENPALALDADELFAVCLSIGLSRKTSMEEGFKEACRVLEEGAYN